MKFVSIGIIVIAMIWTWQLTSRHAEVDEITQVAHINIQENLKTILRDLVEQSLTEAADMRFDRMWTERVGQDQIKATFIYSFKEMNEFEGEITTELEGFAILNREYVPEENLDIWTVDEIQFLNNEVIFDNGITIDAIDSQPSDNE